MSYVPKYLAPEAPESLQKALLVLGQAPNVACEVAIGAKTTYRAGGKASIYFVIDSVADLKLLSDAVKASGSEVLFLGKGSNLLISEEGFTGICCSFSDKMAFVDIDVEEQTVSCGAATSLPQIARQSAATGVGALEWMVGIPGSCGGAVRMNAGGHGSDIASVLRQTRVFDVKTGDMKTCLREEIDFSYRRSPFEDHHVILDALFAGTRVDKEKSLKEIQEIVSWRREHQPGGKNAGSVFKNPAGISAGKLLDELGLKGFRYGSASVSDKHANFFQLDPGGKSNDVFELIKITQSCVAEKTGVVLEPEVRLVGFDVSQLHKA